MHVAPLIPPNKPGGNKRSVDVREVMNGIMYVLSTGCQWRAIPKDLPPRSTLFDYLDLWSWDGTLDRIHHALYVECRERGEREASPTAAIIDSQSVKSAEKGGPGLMHLAMTSARRLKGKKRHILVDMLGLLMHAVARCRRHPGSRRRGPGLRQNTPDGSTSSGPMLATTAAGAQRLAANPTCASKSSSEATT